MDYNYYVLMYLYGLCTCALMWTMYLPKVLFKVDSSNEICIIYERNGSFIVYTDITVVKQAENGVPENIYFKNL